jgi:hypothetical protein
MQILLSSHVVLRLEAAYFFKTYHEPKFQDPTLSGASVPSASWISKANMLLLMAGK